MKVGTVRKHRPADSDHDALIAACNTADRQLDDIAREFDLLMCVSPINTNEAMTEFLRDRCRRPPDFAYRPIAFDPKLLSRQLRKIDFGRLHEPLVEEMLIEKRRELDMQLRLIEARGSSDFMSLSESLYGSVSDELLAAADQILIYVEPLAEKRKTVFAPEVKRRAEALIDKYRAQAPDFEVVVELRDDVAGLLVSYPKLMIDDSVRISERRVDPLLSHEVSVHLLTGFNGEAHGLSIFSTGLAGYEEIQEGLGVFAEWAVNGLTRPRLRLIAGRVIAVHAMLAGADFVECYHILHEEYRLRPRTAFGICARVYRSGGFSKDAIYLRGFFRVMEWVSDGGDLSHFWRAKMAMIHLPAMEKLYEKGIVRKAKLIPEFMLRDSTKSRIQKYRNKPSIEQVFSME